MATHRSIDIELYCSNSICPRNKNKESFVTVSILNLFRKDSKPDISR